MDFIDLKTQQKNIRDRIEKRIKAVLNHGKYIMGPEVFELEERLADYVGVDYCISCSSGTDALLIPLIAKGIGPGDAIITTPFTYIATAEVISLLGAQPIFVDIYPLTYNINPDGIEQAIGRAKRKGLNPKGIIPVDIFGLPARYRLIEKIAIKHNLFILEDAAQAFGSSIRRKKAGSFGNIASTSFFPAKPLGCYGDGGAIFTNDEKLASIMKSIRVHGSGADKYENIRIGLNGRLDTIQAAVLLEKLRIFDAELESRDNAANYYTNNIKSNFKCPRIPKEYKSSWAQYSLLANSEKERFEIMLRLEKLNIPTMIYYKLPLHLQSVYQEFGYSKGDFPFSEKVSNQIFSIPFHPYLQIDMQDKIIEAINNE